MRDWLTYFLLSFFTDKHTQEAHKRSLLNAFGCFFLSLVILLCLLFGGYAAAMSTHYRHAVSYRQTLYTILGDPEYNVKLENGVFSFADLQGANVVINTFTDQAEDACELIIDTRDIQNIFVEFTVQYINAAGIVLSYEAYAALTEDEQSNYTFSAKYSDIPIVFTDSLLASYEQYLQTVDADDIRQSYSALSSRKQNMDRTAYATELYKLYITAYYPSDVLALDLYAFAPTLRTYYEHLIANAGDAPFFAMYQDLAYGRFGGKGGASYTISAASAQLPDQSISQDNPVQMQQQIDQLIKDVFSCSTDTILIEYIFNFVKLSSILLLGSLLLAVLPWMLFKLTKNQRLSAYLTSFQILHLYSPMAAVIGGLTGFALSWFTDRNVTYQTAVLCYAAVVFCRLLLFILQTLFRELKLFAR